MRYVFLTRISNIFERKLKKHISGVGENAIFETNSAGWYIQFNYTTIYVGKDKPTATVGQQIRLILEDA